MGVTFGSVVDNVLQKLKEEVATPAFWERDEIKRYILESLREIAEVLKIFRKNRIVVVETGKRKYPYPDDFIELNRIEFDEKRISPTSSEELDQLSPSWRDKVGDPEAYYTDQCLPGFFEVYKRPDVNGDSFVFSSDYGTITVISSTGDTWTLSSSYGVITDITSTDDEWEFRFSYGVITEILTPLNNLNVFFTGYADEPDSESDEMPKPFHKSTRVPEDFAMWQAFLKEGEAQNLIKATKYEDFFKRDVGLMGTRKDARRRDLRFDSEDVAGRVRKHPKLPDEYPDYGE